MSCELGGKSDLSRPLLSLACLTTKGVSAANFLFDLRCMVISHVQETCFKVQPRIIDILTLTEVAQGTDDSFCILSFLVGTFRFFNALFFKCNFDLKILFLLHYREADRDGLQWRCPQDRTLLPRYGGVSYKKGEKCNMYSLLQFIFIFPKSHPL